jgi:multiple sugar transport system substrate-binding protein
VPCCPPGRGPGRREEVRRRDAQRLDLQRRLPQAPAAWLPEFEALTGAKVNFDAPSFPVYNQRADLELSTKGSAYDVVNVTFIYSSRWINSGWLTPLDDYIRNPT